MLCPKCKSENVTCIDSRPSGDSTRRRRMCLACKYRFSTMEIEVEEYKELHTKEKLLTLMLQKSAEVSDKLKGRFYG